jgi:uncharacterized repeat protein (TIGR03837 family)
MPSSAPDWDIFCRVVDNYGDIGVCWRLARQLVDEHKIRVRLWVDELEALVQIWPEARVTDRQMIAGVDVRRWHSEFPSAQPAAVVIEAFACDIPANYLDAMAAQKKAGQAPVWINLEYLSAESWVDECHGMASIHPATGLRKTFFFPGFGKKAGGVLREQALLEERDQFEPAAWLHQKGISPMPASLRISLFAYENPALDGLLNAWATSPTPIHCLVPAGRILGSINEAITKESGQLPLTQGSRYCRGQLTLEVIPFLTQTEYDRLLWSCDVNFVRGEDSFVRAQWAAKPFVWHIYPQDEGVHLIKLQAFLDKYLGDTASLLTEAIADFWGEWNSGQAQTSSWARLQARLGDWQAHSRRWEQALAQETDLATSLMHYCQTTP